MDNTTIIEFAGRDAMSDPLTELLRKGARELLRNRPIGTACLILG